MEGVILMAVLAMVLLVPLVALAKAAWRGSGEECPESEPDMSDEDREVLRTWTKNDKWAA